MVAGAACKRLMALGTNSGIGLSRFRTFVALQDFSPASRFGYLDCRQISQLANSNGKRLFLDDTLALVISNFP